MKLQHGAKSSPINEFLIIAVYNYYVITFCNKASIVVQITIIIKSGSEPEVRRSPVCVPFAGLFVRSVVCFNNVDGS